MRPSPNYIDQLAAFVRSRPKQPLDAFIRQSNAVIAHDALAQLARIKAPTQITFGRHDMVTSTRFADTMKNGIKGSELVVFETCAHAPIYESVAEFNVKDLELPQAPGRIGRDRVIPRRPFLGTRPTLKGPSRNR